MSNLYYSAGYLAYPNSPAFTVGKTYRTVNARFTVPTTGVAGDQYVFAGPLSLDDRIARITTMHMAALTSATNVNLGFFYKNSIGQLLPVIAGGGNELWNSATLTAAITTFVDVLYTKNNAIDPTKNIRNQLGGIGTDQAPVGGVYLVMTILSPANTAGGLIDLNIDIDESTSR